MAVTPLICGECGQGNYAPQDTPNIGYYECRNCGHEITSFDLVLDGGEAEVVSSGLLCVRSSDA